MPVKKYILMFGCSAVLLLAACGKQAEPVETEAEAVAETTELAEEKKPSEKVKGSEKSKREADTDRAEAESAWSEEEIRDAVDFLNRAGVNALLYSRFEDLASESYFSLYDIVAQLKDDTVDRQMLYEALEEESPDYELETNLRYVSWDRLDTLLRSATGYGLASEIWDQESVGYEERQRVFYVNDGDSKRLPFDAEVITAGDQLLLLCSPLEYSDYPTRFIVKLEKTEAPDAFLVRAIESCGKNAGGKEAEDGSYFMFRVGRGLEELSEKGILTLYDKNAEEVWSYETEAFAMTELDRVLDIGLRDNGYYFAAGGRIYCIDRTKKGRGRVLWRTEEEFGASQSFAFASDGSLHLCGYYGPMLAVIDKDGFTRQYLGEFSFPDGTDPSEFFWPYALSIADDGEDWILFESNNSLVRVNVKSGRVLDWNILGGGNRW